MLVELSVTILAVTAASGQAGAVTQAAAAQTSGERASDLADKMICKRFTETGSLVRSYRTCKTKRDWERERDAAATARSGSGCNDPGNPACRP